MPTTHLFRATAISLAFLATLSCVAPSRSIIPGPAYSLVMEEMEAPSETRVFLVNQHPSSSLPGCVPIATCGFAKFGGASKVEWARKEGNRLKADFVIVSTSTSGGMEVLGLTALRLTPADYGYGQINGTVSAITTDNALNAGLAVGDQILTINGVPFADRFHELMEIQPGALMTFKVKRNGQVLDIQFEAAPNPPVHLDLPEPRSL